MRSRLVASSASEAHCSLASRFEEQLGGQCKSAFGSGAVEQTPLMEQIPLLAC